MAFLEWLEASAFSTWLKLSPSIWAYPAFLFLHTLGLSAAAGCSLAIDLRLLGVARGTPLPPFERFFPLMWTGFWLSVATGAVLFAADATTAVTNPFLAVKLALVAMGIGVAVPIRRLVRDHEKGHAVPCVARWLAMASIAAWCGAIAAAHAMAYLDPTAATASLVGGLR